MSSYSLPLFILCGTFLLSMVLTGVIRRWALSRQLMDIPQSRSAHSVPVPIGGGLSLVMSVLVVSVYCLLGGYISSATFLALCGAYAIALIGLIDDFLELGIRLRVALQFVAAIWSLFWIGSVAPINIGGFMLDQVVILNLLGLFALVWLLNLYNFMDGIDGLAGSELLTTAIFSLAFTLNSEFVGLNLLFAASAGAALGFLIWNWSPAKIFMGDAGSGFVGFLLGLMALFTMQAGLMSLWTWLILLGVFVTDATVTLLGRALTGQRWYEGHAYHGYQHAARHYKSHSKVTITVLVINCVWLGPLAALSVAESSTGWLLCIVALLPLVALTIKWQAGVAVNLATE